MMPGTRRAEAVKKWGPGNTPLLLSQGGLSRSQSPFLHDISGTGVR